MDDGGQHLPFAMVGEGVALANPFGGLAETILAVLPLAYAVVLTLVTFLRWWALGRGRSSGANYESLLDKDEGLAGFTGGEGEPISDGRVVNGEDMRAPLLGESTNGTAEHEGYEGSSAEEDEGETVVTKGKALHWFKIILYLTEITIYGCLALYDVVDGDDETSGMLTNLLLAGAWAVLVLQETLHHLLPSRRSTIFQALFVLITLSLSLADVLKRYNGVPPFDDLESWNLLVMLFIFAIEIWSCCRDTPLKRYSHMNSEYAAGMFSYFHFNWYTPVISTGAKRPLVDDDLPVMIDDDRSATVWTKFSALLYPRGQDGVREGDRLAVGLSVLRMGGNRVWLQAVWAFLSAASNVFPSLFLNQITNYLTDYDAKEVTGIPLGVLLSVAGLFFMQAVSAHADGLMFKLGRRLGIRAKSALISAVFRKAMVLDMSAAQVGQLQNHISVDAESVLNLSVFQMFMWSAAARLVACVILLFVFLGPSAIGGIGLLVITLPANKIIIGKLKGYQQELMKKRDARMEKINEAMNGIRVIKVFAWEEKFMSNIFSARAREVAVLKLYMITLGIFMVTVKSSPTIVGLVTFVFHTQVFGNTLTAAAGFTALSLFQQLRMPLSALPSTINDYIQAMISYRRIASLLEKTTTDVKNTEVYGNRERMCPSLLPGEIKMENSTFRWRAALEGQRPTLRDITLHVQPGELVCIYGPTGGGKSSMLMAMLQELVTESGKCQLNGTIAYVSQRAWIQNATVRDNITFGKPWDPARYDRVIECCALKPDFAIMENGDMTEIGEKGINLSGGQQQRISLARAVYYDADIVLLDDVLSAVDAHVGKHIFDKCIRGFLRGKTRVLVTHQVALTARYADNIFLLNDDGTMRETGTYSSLTEGEGDKLSEILSSVGGPELLRRQSSSVSVDDVKDAAKAAGSAAGAGGGKDGIQGRGIISEETKAVGRPKAALFLSYFRHGGGIYFGAAWIVLSVLWQGLTIAQSFYLREWINEMGNGVVNGRGFYLYIGVSVATFVALLLRTIVITSGSVRASKKLHDAMVRRLFGAPTSFFDMTPLGRIFNRMSSDIVTLDKDLMNDVLSYTDMLLSVVGVVVVIVAAIPILTVFMVPIVGICFWYGAIYLHTSRRLKRLEAVNRSPLYAHFSESVNGVTTIRAYSAEDRFISVSQGHVDKLNRTHLYLWVANYWLTNRLRLIGALVCGLVGAFLVADVKNIDGATGGLVLSYALQYTVSVVFTVRLHAQMEMSVNSIERIDEYCKIAQEAPPIIPDCRPPPGWPSAGRMHVENLSLKYASSSEPVLHGLTFDVPKQTRVGIVGRTGAGKSSLSNALFRMVEPMEGSVVEIDGVNVLNMGLRDLRSNLAIVPQDPTVFEGTVREGLDPFGEFSDLEIWEALRQAHLYDFVSRTDGKLDHIVFAGGSNLSVGQRQLLCMARALLRKAAVIV
jgi:ATP-binding cassette subfamily C (CFTR/MRP) protein 1